MKPVIYLIIICVIGYFVWQYTTQPSQPRIVKPPVFTQPPPLPSGKAVSDQYKSLIVGAEIYYDVTVRKVFPDSIAISHRDGAANISLSKVSKQIQTKYGYDPANAAEYVALKAAHLQYNKDKKIKAEQKQEEKASVEEAPTEPPKPSLLTQIRQLIPFLAPTPTPSPTPPPPTPEEQLLALISDAPVEATKLTVLCDQYPAQANVILKGKQIKVSGIIKRLWVRGIQSADMDIDLVGTPRKDVVFSTDYARYNAEHTGSSNYSYKLVKSGMRLLMYSPHRKTGGGEVTSLDRVVHTEGDKVTLEGLIEVVGPGDIKIHYAKGILN